MDLSPIGEAVLIAREGRRLKAYSDSVGVLTIGIGHTSAAGPPKVTAGLAITAAECDAIFRRDIRQYVEAVRRGLTVAVPQHAFDALVSLCFNIGTGAFARSTLLKRINAGADPDAVEEAFLMWRKPAEIFPRRQAEAEQFRTPYAVALPRQVRGAKPIAVAAPVAAVLDKTKPTPVIEPVVVPPSTSWWGGLAGWLGGLFRSAAETEAHAETKGGATSA